MSFEDIGVPARVSEVLRKQGITSPNPVQQDSIPPLMTGSDAVIHAPTGSGKTLGYLLPMLTRLRRDPNSGPQALIVAPTRELATQIDTVLRGLNSGVRSALVFGGVPYGNQLRNMRQRPQVVIGCPGRLLDLINRGALNLASVRYLVLDEADEMLDQGFARDVEQILTRTPSERQTVLASATMPEWVRTMIEKHLRQPTLVHVEGAAESTLEHGLFAVSQQAKTVTLDRLLSRQKGQTIVFHRTKHGVKKLARDLSRLGHATDELQGNLSQNARDRAMRSFRKGDCAVLVATDVAARGIDVAHVGLVVNYELPETAEWLTHRIGRTARNGAEGKAITFVTPEDGAKWTKLRRQGAPDLGHIDVDRLLDHGEWSVAPNAPERHKIRHSTPPIRSHERPDRKSNGWRSRESGRHNSSPYGARPQRPAAGRSQFPSRPGSRGGRTTTDRSA